MALDREGAKAAASARESADSELEAGILTAHEYRLKLAEYTHTQDLLSKELGWVGQFLGGEKSAPTAIASIVLLITVFIFAGMYLMAIFGSIDGDKANIIMSAADKCLALGTLALGYVCGKGK